MGGLFSRFPGSTDPALVNVQGCDLIVEPFAGSLNVTCAILGGTSGIKRAIAADTDPTIRVVMDVYKHPKYWTPVLDEILSFWVPKFKAHPDDSWQALKDRFEMIPSSFFCTEEHAAVSLLYRSLAHAGIVRCSKSSGKINVSMGKDQLAALPTKRWAMPLLPPGCKFEFYDHWSKAIAAIPDDARACVLVDPPYWSPLGMEPCYPGHQPRATKTLALFHDSILAAILHPGAHRVVTKNYVGQQAPGGSIEFWPQMELSFDGWHIHREITGTLSACAAPYKHGNRVNKPDKPKNVEAFWTIQRELITTPKQLELIT